VDTLTTNPLFDYSSIFSFSNPKICYYFSIFLWAAIPSLNPAIFQRVAMANSAKQASNAFIIASIVFSLIAVIACWIGILILSIYPNLIADNILKTLISDYAWITGFKGLILAGIMAMVMSTIDSYINSSAVLLTHDLRESLSLNFIKNELSATRTCSMLIGMIAILFAMRSGSFLDMFIWASMFYMPIVTVPLMMSILGFRSSSKSVLTGMGVGFITAMVWELFIKEKMGNVGGLIPGMLANLIFLIGSHYLLKQPGGWTKTTSNEDSSTILKKKSIFQEIFRKIISLNLMELLKKNTPQSEIVTSLFGLFIIISTFFSINTISKDLQGQYGFLFNLFGV
jgi:Na+/proline symporter